MGVRVKVGFKDSVGVQIGQKFPEGTFGVHGASGALGAHGRLGATPLATNCWPKAPRGGGGGGARTGGVAPPVQSVNARESGALRAVVRAEGVPPQGGRQLKVRIYQPAGHEGR